MKTTAFSTNTNAGSLTNVIKTYEIIIKELDFRVKDVLAKFSFKFKSDNIYVQEDDMVFMHK